MEVTGITFEPGRRGQAGRFGPGRRLLVEEGLPVFERALNVEAVLYPTAFPAAGQRAGIVHSPEQYSVSLVGDQGDVACRTPGGEVVARQVVRLSTWTTVRCFFGRNRIEIVVNGEPAAEGDHDLSFEDDESPVQVGATDEGAPYTGLLDELRIWRGRQPLD